MSEEDREKKKEFVRQYYQANKEKILSNQRDKYANKSKEVKQGYSRSYYDLHKEEICKRSREFYKNRSQEKKQKNVERVRIWREKNRQKARAWSAVGNALVRGDIIKPNVCQVCEVFDQKLHAHHEDYEKPLDVKWLCHVCHMKIHKIKRRTK